MSFDLMRKVMGVNLGTTRKMILMSLADSVNGNLRDLVCWPSLARIARQ